MAGPGVYPKSGGAVDLIYQSDYNTIQSIIAGVKTTTYGVACASSQISGSPNRVTAQQWNNLKTDIDNCRKHQTGSNTAITTKTAGADVITASAINLYKTEADAAETNKLTVYAATQLALVTGASSVRTNSWNTSITHSVQVDFASSADAGYFFDSGGYFVIDASCTNETGQKNDAWETAIASVGSTFGRSEWNSGGSNVALQIVYVNSPYGASYYRASYTKNSATRVTFTMLFNDAAGGNPYIDENITIDITSTLDYYRSTDAIVTSVPSSITNTATLQ